MVKYPRTPHRAGSRLQPGDEDLAQTPFTEVRGRFVVAEEKLDGANAGISFTAGGQLRSQSRGHYLSGGTGNGCTPSTRSSATPCRTTSASSTSSICPLGTS